MRFSSVCFCVASAFLILTNTVSASVTIAPNDSAIQYFGRFDMANPLQPRCEWTGSHIKVAFTGTSVAATVVSNGKVYLDIIIDSVVVKVDSVTAVERSLVCATGLANTTHRLVLYVRSEDGVLTFKGLTLDNSATAASPGPCPARKIEFIGDSYTVGYANEATNSGVCAYTYTVAPVTDNYRSWAPRAARACSAEYIEVAKSGWGMVRNCWTPATSDSTIGTLYLRTLVNSKTPLWNFGSWKPDLVCIGIGTNDFTNCNPGSPATQLADSANFVNAFCGFLDTVRSRYSGVKIMLNVPTARARVENCVRQVAAAERASGKTDVFYSQWQWDTASNSMCWHPNVYQDSLVGTAMADSIMKFMGWNGTGTASPAAAMRSASAAKSLVVRRVSGNDFVADASDGSALDGPVCLYRLNGEQVAVLHAQGTRGVRAVYCPSVKGVVIVVAKSNGVRFMSAPLPLY
ncbi:MAG TPA: GDSL-type esterase/lipase family protein [Chitinivibrionales bacterium]|nr:GDSL-type esterase/lipase family protein [Chitinivibrionales bacterium]